LELSFVYLQKDQILGEVGQLTFVHSRKRGFNILFYEMSQFDAVQLSNFFGTGVNGSRVKINNKIG